MFISSRGSFLELGRNPLIKSQTSKMIFDSSFPIRCSGPTGNDGVNLEEFPALTKSQSINFSEISWKKRDFSPLHIATNNKNSNLDCISGFASSKKKRLKKRRKQSISTDVPLDATQRNISRDDKLSAEKSVSTSHLVSQTHLKISSDNLNSNSLKLCQSTLDPTSSFHIEDEGFAEEFVESTVSGYAICDSLATSPPGLCPIQVKHKSSKQPIIETRQPRSNYPETICRSSSCSTSSSRTASTTNTTSTPSHSESEGLEMGYLQRLCKGDSEQEELSPSSLKFNLDSTLTTTTDFKHVPIVDQQNCSHQTPDTTTATTTTELEPSTDEDDMEGTDLLHLISNSLDRFNAILHPQDMSTLTSGLGDSQGLLLLSDSDLCSNQDYMGSFELSTKKTVLQSASEIPINNHPWSRSRLAGSCPSKNLVGPQSLRSVQLFEMQRCCSSPPLNFFPTATKTGELIRTETTNDAPTATAVVVTDSTTASSSTATTTTASSSTTIVKNTRCSGTAESSDSTFIFSSDSGLGASVGSLNNFCASPINLTMDSGETKLDNRTTKNLFASPLKSIVSSSGLSSATQSVPINPRIIGCSSYDPIRALKGFIQSDENTHSTNSNLSFYNHRSPIHSTATICNPTHGQTNYWSVLNNPMPSNQSLCNASISTTINDSASALLFDDHELNFVQPTSNPNLDSVLSNLNRLNLTNAAAAPTSVSTVSSNLATNCTTSSSSSTSSSSVSSVPSTIPNESDHKTNSSQILLNGKSFGNFLTSLTKPSAGGSSVLQSLDLIQANNELFPVLPDQSRGPFERKPVLSMCVPTNLGGYEWTSDSNVPNKDDLHSDIIDPSIIQRSQIRSQRFTRRSQIPDPNTPNRLSISICNNSVLNLPSTSSNGFLVTDNQCTPSNRLYPNPILSVNGSYPNKTRSPGLGLNNGSGTSGLLPSIGLNSTAKNINGHLQENTRGLSAKRHNSNHVTNLDTSGHHPTPLITRLTKTAVLPQSNINSAHSKSSQSGEGSNLTATTIDPVTGRPVIAKWRRACSFYLRGHCKKEDCEFAHDLTKVTCKFWEMGECFKGVTCPFLHGYPPELTMS